MVSVVVEHGDQSARATSVAKSIFDYYFDSLNNDGEDDELSETED